jgi:hypothetical protein
MKHYVKHRPFKFYSIILVAIGLVLKFLADRRTDSLFDGGGIKLGFGPEYQGWFWAHCGQLGFTAIGLGVFLYLLDHGKEARKLLSSVLLLLAVQAVSAADLTPGYSFTPNDRVTSTKLNSLAGEAIVNTTLATDKSSAQPLAADTILFYQSSSGNWRKTTFDQLLLSNTNLIVGQIESDSPTTNDFFLFYDASAGTLAKVPLDGLLTNLFLIAQRQEFTNGPLPELSYVLIVSNNVPFRVSWSNFFQYWWRDERFSTNVASSNPLTNPFVLSVHTAPTNRDALVIWDAQGQTNKVTTLEGLITNLPPARPGLTNGDTFQFIQTRTNSVNPFGTNEVLSKMTLADLFTNYVEVPSGTVTSSDTLLIFSTATNSFTQSTGTVAKVKMSSLIQKFYTNGIPLSGTGFQVNGQHGLGGTPQIVKWYLMQTNSGGDASYLQGDIVPVEDFESAANAVVFAGGANSTNVFLTMRTTAPQVCTKAGATLTAITLSKWNAVCEAIYYP